MLEKAFGKSIENLIEIQGLATAPEHQGKGYGTALMLLANAMADVQKRGVYLVTTDAHGFYQRFGYRVVEEDVLGVDNPKWTGEPVHIRVRKAEFRGKIMEFVKDAFGAQVNEMYDLQSLATAPEAQGQGYASALVNAVTDMADAEGRDTWVITVSASGFYEQLGFYIVREGVLGDDNPSWEGGPIPVFVLRKHASNAKGSPKNDMVEKC
ncbi:hypothetical protein TRAPUB_13319 [Trametes pubescens]|uniref:N-acetyltransferase domain-containing protein n=1 Tax=Trametes pubescens TaxID=154538 RepID=A0A1M2VRH8_TRAPU|nr:hypothetical protein TRAPUB_13319 [Trametes pubescens]